MSSVALKSIASRRLQQDDFRQDTNASVGSPVARPRRARRPVSGPGSVQPPLV